VLKSTLSNILFEAVGFDGWMVILFEPKPMEAN